MRLTLYLSLIVGILATGPALAGDRQTLGYGRIFNNDALGDGRDRWRTGSYAVSRVTGEEDWTGAPPWEFGAVRELRLRGEIIAPDNLTAPAPAPKDRRYAGLLSFGMHTHFSRGPYELSVGGDLVITGPQTGLSEFQDWAHEAFDVSEPLAVDDEIDNAVRPTVLAQAVRPIPITETFSLRPFVEAQAGVETYLRVGSDVIIGGVGHRDLLIRDSATGQLYRATQDDAKGLSFVLGGDIAKVTDSFLLPSSDGYVLTSSRRRLRAGMHWEGDKAGMFYGISWLDEEFKGQGEAQLVGSLRLRIAF